jgi:hypothetical protein
MGHRRYNIKNLKKSIYNPSLLKNELCYWHQTMKNKIIVEGMYNGENFMEKDWDNLIILDACRPDFFEKYNQFDGELSCETSLGASSPEFFQYNFRNKEFHDTIYVTGNTNIERIPEDSVHKIIKTYAETTGVNKGWLPKPTLDSALRAYQKYPNKRIVVHFMQPHAPYLGDRAKELRKRVTEEYGVGFRYVEVMEAEGKKKTDEQIENLLRAYERGYISRDALDEVYGENLSIVFEYVEKLLNNIEGKSIITSDHSESFGDFNGIYGHKDFSLSKRLREVPWFVIEGDRRNTFSESPIGSTAVDEDVVRENLRDLGYL